MLRNLVDLKNYRVHAIDGAIGAIHDMLFDDQQWVVRYFVVDTDPWMPGRKVLISPVVVGRVDWNSHHLRVRLTRDQVKDAPGVGADPPVSRQEEERLVAYYAWPAYWGVPEPHAHSPAPPEQREAVAAEVEKLLEAAPHDDPHLRSLREVAGYHISARDGPLGHVQGFLGNEEDWVIRYLVMDARGGAPAKTMLLPPPWISRVDWTRAEVVVDVARDKVEQAPPYRPAPPLDREYEKQLYAFYDRPPYWNGGPGDAGD